MCTTVTIVGRPNVGKSTLFNRLVGKRLAIVDSRPGVTRDRREAVVNYGDVSFILVDTAGLMGVSQKQREMVRVGSARWHTQTIDTNQCH